MGTPVQDGSKQVSASGLEDLLGFGDGLARGFVGINYQDNGIEQRCEALGVRVLIHSSGIDQKHVKSRSQGRDGRRYLCGPKQG